MLRPFARAAALLPALWLSAAGAFGLGEIEVRSRLNQPFSASIPLTGLSAEQAESVIVNLASNADFERAGVERADFLTALKFEVQSRDGQPRIQISSREIAREPFVSFLVDVRGASSRLLREYTVLLDPPDSTPATAAPKPKPAAAVPAVPAQTPPAAPTPAPAPASAVAPVAATPSAPVPQPAAAVPSAPSPPPSASEAPAASSSAGRYGPIKPQETLWSIALKLRPDASIGMDQMQIGLYDANPKAFDRGLMLLRDVTLNVPDAETLRAIDAAEARQRVAALNANPGARAAAAPPSSAPAAATEKPVQPAAAVPPAAAPTPAQAAPQAEAASAAAPPAAPAAATEPASEPAPEPAVETPVAESAPSEASAPETSSETDSKPVIRVVEEPVTEESGGLMQALALPLLALLLAGLGWGGWQFIKRNSGGQKLGSLVPSSSDRAAAAVAASAEARAAEERADQAEAEVLAAYNKPAADEPVPVHSQTQTQQVVESTLTQTSQLPDFNATHIFDAPESKTSSLPTDHVDFDVTSQFEAGTVQIDLNAGDPLAEADFHLAYGLYDEAALLLRKALEKDPGNGAAAAKLAETYFAAGKATEFQEIAEDAKRLLPAADWQKLAIMGRQLCPGVPLFMGSEADASLSSDVDLSFDEPAAPASAQAEPALDFRAEIPEPMVAPTPEPAASASNALEFNLDDFKLPEPAAEPPPAVAADEKLDFASFDLELSTPPADTPAPKLEEGISLEDFDLGADSTSISSGDEVATKLDLARAYVDMGDNEMARSLLDEVQQQGNEEQQREAQTLISRLG